MSEYESVHQKILSWYECNGRKDLPWRTLKEEIPYRVYISEIMLQQTQVKTALPYFYRFIQRFPDLESLSQVGEDEVLLYWQGLGYYSRAKNILKTAQICAQKYQGKLPDDFDRLLKLPGIGEYTAGAILCFGFKKSCSFWDGNIRRLLCRFFGIKISNKKILDDRAKSFLNTQNSYDHNQALLDLGALVCVPKNASCHLCPLQDFCQGKDNPAIYDQRQKMVYEDLALHFGIYINQDKIAMLRDSKSHSLFGFPEIAPTDQKSFLQLKHSRTKYRIRAYLYHIEKQPSFTQMIPLDQTHCYPMSALSLKILKKIQQDTSLT